MILVPANKVEKIKYFSTLLGLIFIEITRGPLLLGMQWRSHGGGGGSRGQSAPLDSKKIAKKREKITKEGKRGTIGKVLSRCPSWQRAGYASVGMSNEK